MTFDYSLYPCESAFIDGEHDYDHPYHEAIEMAKLHTPLIIFHDADIEQVYDAIINAFNQFPEYRLFRVIDTRIAFAKIEIIE